MRKVVPDCVPSGIFKRVIAFEGGHLDLGSESSLGVRNRDHAIEIVALALEEGMLLYVQYDVEIARRTPKTPASP